MLVKGMRSFESSEDHVSERFTIKCVSTLLLCHGRILWAVSVFLSYTSSGSCFKFTRCITGSFYVSTLLLFVLQVTLFCISLSVQYHLFFTGYLFQIAAYMTVAHISFHYSTRSYCQSVLYSFESFLLFLFCFNCADPLVDF